MSTLTFESYSSSSRRVAARRAYRPAKQPAVQHSSMPLRNATATTRATNGKAGGMIAIVTVTLILHGLAIYKFNQPGEITVVKKTVTPLTIDIAPPPPAEPPKQQPQTVKPQAAPPKPAPSVPIVAEAPVDNSPSPDAVQVAAAPAPAPPAPEPAPAPVETVTEPRGYAGYLNNPAPAYPPAALLKGLQGSGVLNVHVLASGHVDSITVFKSTGHQILDDAYIKTIMSSWVFEPAKRGSKAIDGWVKIPIKFKIS